MFMMMLSVLSEDDREKAELLVERYQNLLYAVAYRIIGNEQDAEDIVLTAWEKVLGHLDRIDLAEENRTKGFLVTVTENTAINVYRKNKRKTDRESNLPESSPYFMLRETEYGSVEVAECFRHMEREYGEVLLLYFIHEHTLKEIGKLLGISESTASRRLGKGVRILKEYIEGGCGNEDR